MKTVLLIDDEQAVLSVAARMLRAEGHRAIMAVGGEEAVRIFRERHAEIDLVIVDYLMPGMDGYETCQALRRINPNVPIVMASGVEGDISDAGLSSAAISLFLRKPYSLEQLGTAVRQAG